MIRVENSGKGPLKLRFGVVLSPGVNNVDPTAWDKCKSDPITQHYLNPAVGRVKVLGIESSLNNKGPSSPAATHEDENSSSPSNGGEEEAPKRMSARDTKKYVKTCRSPEVLHKMLEEEDRTSVKDAIEVRLEEIGHSA